MVYMRKKDAGTRMYNRMTLLAYIKCELKSLFLILEKIATHTNVSMERKSLFFRSLFLC